MEPRKTPPADITKAVFPPPTPNRGERPIVNPKRDSFSTIAAELKLDVWDLIEFNFPGSRKKPDVVNWYLFNKMGARQTTQDGQNYIFPVQAKVYFPKNGPVPVPGPTPTPPPPLGFTPPVTHPFGRGWTASNVRQFHQDVERVALRRVNSFASVLDCANFAIELVIDFAMANRLPVAFQHEGGILLADFESITSARPFKDAVKAKVGARDLFNQSFPQTVKLAGFPALLPGDIICTSHHVIVNYRYGALIEVPGVAGKREVLEVVQGNLDTYPFPNRQGARDFPTRIQHRAFDLRIAAGYLDEGNGWEVRDGREGFQEAIAGGGFAPKRWNFSWFNQAYGFPPVGG